MCIVYVLYVINSAQVYMYIIIIIIIIYTVVSLERRGRNTICIYHAVCMARRLATTRAANKYLIFQTTSQPELLAAVFDPIIKSFSSSSPRCPLHADRRYCRVYVYVNLRGGECAHRRRGCAPRIRDSYTRKVHDNTRALFWY